MRGIQRYKVAKKGGENSDYSGKEYPYYRRQTLEMSVDK
jgi:hypothetical protein